MLFKKATTNPLNCAASLVFQPSDVGKCLANVKVLSKS